MYLTNIEISKIIIINNYYKQQTNATLLFILLYIFISIVNLQYSTTHAHNGL